VASINQTCTFFEPRREGSTSGTRTYNLRVKQVRDKRELIVFRKIDFGVLVLASTPNSIKRLEFDGVRLIGTRVALDKRLPSDDAISSCEGVPTVDRDRS
jgi:hypothetical protein